MDHSHSKGFRLLTCRSSVEGGGPIRCPCSSQQRSAAWMTVNGLFQTQRHIHGVESSQSRDAHNEAQHPEVCPAI